MLEVFLFGLPRFEEDGEAIVLERRKAIALLAYLAVTEQAFSRDAVATLLWPENDQAHARTALRQTLATITASPLGRWFNASRDSLSFPAAETLVIDVRQFTALLNGRRAHRHSLDVVCERCVEPLKRAVQHYRGDFMAGFTLRDSPEFDDWQRGQTQQYRQAYLEALEALVSVYSIQREFSAALELTQRWLEFDPYSEAGYRRLMRLYAWTDQRAAALQQYEIIVQRLEEWGVSPHLDTSRLYQSLKQGVLPPFDQFLGSADDGLKPNILSLRPLPPNNLLAPVQPFIGRTVELTQVLQRIDNPDCRLLSLVGPGGIGKTRLALQAARQRIADFAQGVYFINLAPLKSSDLLVLAIANNLRFSFQSERSAKTQLLDYLRQKEMLLVLDNFEHLVDGANLLSDLLETAPRIKILVTTRERLQLYEEWLFEVGGMQVPTDENSTSSDRNEAIQLFMHTAHRVQPTFPLAPNQSLIIEICQLLQGMPLAIELAAAWVWSMSPEQIRQQIANDRDFLASSLRNIPERHRSLRATFNYSWELLLDGERTALINLAAFRGGFDSNAAARVTATTLEILQSLVVKSLLHVDGEDRYNMHELIRQFAEEKLVETPKQEKRVRDQHAGYFADYLNTRATALQSHALKSAHSDIALEFDNVQAAWHWILNGGAVAEIEKALPGLATFYWMQGWYRDGITLLESAAQQLSAISAPVTGQIMARTGWFHIMLTEWQIGEDLLQQSLTLCDSTADQIFAVNRLGYSLFRRTDYANAIHRFEQSLAYLHSDSNELAFTLIYLAAVYEAEGRYEDAKQRLHEGLDMARQAENPFYISYALNGLGDVLLRQGNYADAHDIFHEAFTVQRATNQPHLIAQTLLKLGWAAFRQGDYAAAKQQFEEGLMLHRELGTRHGIANALNGLGSVAAVQKSFFEAVRLFQESLELYREIGVPGGVNVTLTNLGRVNWKLGRYAEAEAVMQEGLKISQKSGNQRLMAIQLNDLGNIACGQGHYQGAWTYLKDGLKLAYEITVTGQVLESLVGIARLFSQTGELETAKVLINLVLVHPACEQETRDEAIDLRAQIYPSRMPEAAVSVDVSLDSVVQGLLSRD
jgi:predicted ATPase/DNA-binding SARP family transcriptional activator/uncharacterized protein HemY